MNQQNNDSNKITFKVKFLNEYHDITIDWNDEKYSFKPQQVFEQLQSITGILSRYNPIIVRHVTQLAGEWQPADVLKNNEIYGNLRNDKFDGSSFIDGEWFHLSIDIIYDRNDYFMDRISTYYRLIPIDEVPEGVCSSYVCQYNNTKDSFNKIRDFINDDKLNFQISKRVRSIDQYYLSPNWPLEMDKIYKEFNVQQYLRWICSYKWLRDSINGTGQRHIYFRSRG